MNYELSHIKKIFAKAVFLFFVIFYCFSGFAQIGIDNATPNPYATLDMKAPDKGMLLPRMTTAQRFNIRANCLGSGTCPTGLLVYDTDQKAFFYMVASNWYLLNPWNSPDANQVVAEDILTHSIMNNVGINISPNPGYKLDVNGNAKMSGSLNVFTDVQVMNGNMSTGGNFTATLGSLNCAQNIGVTGSVNAPDFSTDLTKTNVAGPVPMGGIILWSGALIDIPAGWSLCDGSNGTPDLSGKFIIGAGTRDAIIRDTLLATRLGGSASFNTNDEGGFDWVGLDVTHIHRHSHDITFALNTGHTHFTATGNDGGDGNGTGLVSRYKGYGDDDSYSLKGPAGDSPGNYKSSTNWVEKHGHTGTTTDTGTSSPHKNVPVYLVLAYIMKL